MRKRTSFQRVFFIPANFCPHNIIVKENTSHFNFNFCTSFYAIFFNWSLNVEDLHVPFKIQILRIKFLVVISLHQQRCLLVTVTRLSTLLTVGCQLSIPFVSALLGNQLELQYTVQRYVSYSCTYMSIFCTNITVIPTLILYMQFDDVCLMAALSMMEKSELGDPARGNPLLVVKALSRVVSIIIH